MAIETIIIEEQGQVIATFPPDQVLVVSTPEQGGDVVTEILQGPAGGEGPQGPAGEPGEPGGISIGDVVGGAEEGGLFFAGVDGIFQQDTDNLFWHNNNKRLGLGTTNPNYRFHLHNPTGPSNWIQITSAATGDTPVSGLFFGTSTTESQIWSASDLAFIVGSNRRFSISEDGYASIGASLPSSNSKLTIISDETTQGTFSGYSDFGAVTGSGKIALGKDLAFQGIIQYNWSGGDLFIDNTWNSANAEIIFRLKTSGTPITPLTLSGSGETRFNSGIVNFGDLQNTPIGLSSGQAWRDESTTTIRFVL